MNPEHIQSMISDVVVHTADYRGHTPEEIAERALDKIIYVGKDSNPLLLEQAKAFKDGIRAVLIHYLREAQTAERTTICGHLIKGGHADLAEIIRRF
jgi:hypothetical protein